MDEIKEVNLKIEEPVKAKPLPKTEYTEFNKKQPSEHELEQAQNYLGDKHKIVKSSTILFMKISVVLFIISIFVAIILFNHTFGTYIQKSNDVNVNTPVVNNNNFTIMNNITQPDINYNPTTNISATIQIINPTFIINGNVSNSS